MKQQAMGKHIVYCWEMGSGLGHIMQFAHIARALMQYGHRVSAVLKDTSLAASLLSDLGVTWYQAPAPQSLQTLAAPINHADLLHYNGYENANELAGLIGGWKSLFELLRPDLIITEAAPTALLISKFLRLVNINLDSGYFIPQLTTPLPPLRTWEVAVESDLTAREQRTLRIVNEALERFGYSPLHQFKELFEANTYWLNWYELRHFEQQYRSRFLGPVLASNNANTGNPASAQRRGILVYLKPDNPASIKALNWCLGTGRPVFAYLPKWPTQVLRQLAQHEKLHIHTQPLDFEEMLPMVELLVCHGGLGSVCQSIAHGVVPLVVPSQVEQFRMFLALSRNGLTARFQEIANEFRVDINELRAAAHRVREFLADKAQLPWGLELLIRILNETAVLGMTPDNQEPLYSS